MKQRNWNTANISNTTSPTSDSFLLIMSQIYTSIFAVVIYDQIAFKEKNIKTKIFQNPSLQMSHFSVNCMVFKKFIHRRLMFMCQVTPVKPQSLLCEAHTFNHSTKWHANIVQCQGKKKGGYTSFLNVLFLNYGPSKILWCYFTYKPFH